MLLPSSLALPLVCFWWSVAVAKSSILVPSGQIKLLRSSQCLNSFKHPLFFSMPTSRSDWGTNAVADCVAGYPPVSTLSRESGVLVTSLAALLSLFLSRSPCRPSCVIFISFFPVTERQGMPSRPVFVPLFLWHRDRQFTFYIYWFSHYGDAFSAIPVNTFVIVPSCPSFLGDKAVIWGVWSGAGIRHADGGRWREDRRHSEGALCVSVRLSLNMLEPLQCKQVNPAT